MESRRLLSTGPLHVDADSTAADPNGLDWDTAYPALQDALDRATVLNTDTDAENDTHAIWIADGVYVPSKDKHGSDSPYDPRTVTFSLLSGVSLYGGFAGTEESLDARVHEADGSGAHETILSGDLAGNDVPSYSPSQKENAYTVVYASDLSDPLTLDALTITAGLANGLDDDSNAEWRDGGGVYVHSSEIAVSNSTLSGNSAGDWSYDGYGGYGGGIYNSGELTVAGSTLVGNGGVEGGAIYNTGELTVANSTISGNAAGIGGGIFNAQGPQLGPYGTLTVTNSIVSLNGPRPDADIHGPLTAESASNLIGIDPRFVRNPDQGPDGWWFTADDDPGDLHLTADSPAVNFGDNDAVPPNAVSA